MSTLELQLLFISQSKSNQSKKKFGFDNGLKGLGVYWTKKKKKIK